MVSEEFPPANNLFVVIPLLGAGLVTILLGPLLTTTAHEWPPPDPWYTIRVPLVIRFGIAIILGDAVFGSVTLRNRIRRGSSGS